MSNSAAEAFPDGVPLVVPSSWKRATLAAPVPVVRCTYIFPDTHERPGEQCKRWSLRGAQKCVKHGGQLENVREHAEAMVEAARLRLIGSLDEATDWLLDLAANSTSDAVRLKATTEVMDRSGLKGGVEIDVNVSEAQDPGTLLRERLATLKRRTVEGELEKDEAPTLPGTAIAGSSLTAQHRDNCHCGSNDPEEHRAYWERYNAARDDTLSEDSPAAPPEETQ